ncbi:MAG: hypothetical protein RDU89_11885 [bacterium]|nr:hypothetical protein [bacterium]
MGRSAWAMIAVVLVLAATIGCGGCLRGPGAPDAGGAGTPSGHSETGAPPVEETAAAEEIGEALESLDDDLKALVDMLDQLEELTDDDLTF